MDTDKKNRCQKLDYLIDQWCERRALRPLRILLSAYPDMPVHTDQFYNLLEGLRDIKGLCHSQLTSDELGYVTTAMNELEEAVETAS